MAVGPPAGKSACSPSVGVCGSIKEAAFETYPGPPGPSKVEQSFLTSTPIHSLRTPFVIFFNISR